MTADVIDLDQFRRPKSDPDSEALPYSMENLPLGFRNYHCAKAREMLGWSVEALAFRSGVSPDAIRRIEQGAELRRVTMQALAFAMEAENLIFIPKSDPMTGGNVCGATPDPRTRDDYNLIE
ncbi:multiprotein-bridging factor 1 family protein [Pseudomonas putida]|uniref:helix-turn-helix domain-containing protein n=1 Tax=Pseudomonas putida TaxID=303 RepID=UPI0035A4700B